MVTYKIILLLICYSWISAYTFYDDLIPITFNEGFDMRHVPTRIQLYIRTKAKLNIGTHCGFLDCVSRYSKVFQIQRVFPLNQNIIEAEYYVNKKNYKEQLEYV